MKRKLFLTGPIGCGKSTAIAKALGFRSKPCGGFFTRRHREPYLHFTLESPDGLRKETFLTFSSRKPEVCLDAFQPELLTGSPLILDEIGGIELLVPEFAAALEAVLKSDVPIIGVFKGEGPAGALIKALNLAEQYEAAASRLRRFLQEDENTLLYQCGQFDETACLLAEQWAEEYLHD